MSSFKPQSPIEERSCKRQRVLSFSGFSIEFLNPDCVLVYDENKKLIFIGFFKKHNWMSNHHLTDSIKLETEVNGKMLKLEGECTEKLFMLLKAHYFNAPEELIKQIETCCDPQVMQKLGRQIPNFSQEEWNKVSRKFMKECTLAKYKCNPALLEKLLETGEAYIAEASKHDKNYGIGISAETVAEIIGKAIVKGEVFDGSIEDFLKTQVVEFGANVLGECLMEARRELAPAV